MTRSRFGNINYRDVFHGFLIAFETAALAGLISLMSDGTFPNILELKTLFVISLSAGGAYVLKTVFQNSDGKLGKKEPDNTLK